MDIGRKKQEAGGRKSEVRTERQVAGVRQGEVEGHNLEARCEKREVGIGKRGMLFLRIQCYVIRLILCLYIM